MSKLAIGLIVAGVVFFIIGMVAGNYNCGAHFCNAISSAVNFAADVVKTEAKGITTVVGGISKVFS